MTNKQTRRQQRTRAKQHQKEKRHRKKTEKTRKRHYPPAQHTFLKKLLITALASSPGITPFKPNPLQRGESGVRDIDYGTFKHFKIPKATYKVGKEYSKRFDRETKKHVPRKVSFLPVVEEPLIGEYLPPKLSPRAMRRTQKRKHK